MASNSSHYKCETSFASYLTFLKANPASWKDVEFQFLQVLDNIAEKYLAKDNLKCVVDAHHKAMEILPSVPEIPLRLGHVFYLNNCLDEACQYYYKAAEIDGECVGAKECIETVINAMVERWHFRMLNDKKRNVAFKNVICNVVKARNVKSAIDIGSGTGLLTMMAVDAGVQHTYAIETSKIMCDISSKLFLDHKMSDKVTLINKHSEQLKIPSDIPSIESIGLIMSETLDSGVFGEGILGTCCYAHENLMTDSTIFVPMRVKVFGCLIQSKCIRKRQRVLSNKIGGFDLKGFCICAEPNQQPYTSELLEKIRGGYERLCQPFEIADLSFNDYKKVKRFVDGITIRRDVKCNNDGIVDALAVWFDLHIDEQNMISSSPEANSCWEQAVFPVIYAQSDKQQLIHVKHDDQLSVVVKCQGHLTLENLSVIGKSKAVPKSNEHLIFLDSSIIEELNGSYYSRNMHENLKRVDWSGKTLIDIEQFPVGASSPLMLGAAHVDILTSPYDELLVKLAAANGVDLSKMKFYSSVDEFGHRGDKRDALIVNPVGSNGTLMNGVLEDVAILRSTALKPHGVVIPYEISVYCCLIYSDELDGQSRVVDDANVIGYNISAYMNKLVAYTHLDLDLRMMKHDNLTVPQSVLKIELNEPLTSRCPNSDSNLPSFVKQVAPFQLDIIKSGQITAMPYWFVYKVLKDSSHWLPAHENGHFTNGLDSHDNNEILQKTVVKEASEFHYNEFESLGSRCSTLDMSSHWRQAAVLFENRKNVSEGQVVDGQALCEVSCIRLRISN